MLILQTCIINVVVVINISRLSTYFLCLINALRLLFRTYCHPLYTYKYVTGDKNIFKNESRYSDDNYGNRIEIIQIVHT